MMKQKRIFIFSVYLLSSCKEAASDQQDDSWPMTGWGRLMK